MKVTGKLLDVNLTTGEIRRERIDASTMRTYMGGSGLATYFLLREMAPGVDPLGPDNVLAFAVSPLADTPISGISRITAAAKSPLTGGIGDSQAGGFFPAEFRRAGWDVLLIRGRAPRPVYLVIRDDQVELRDARHLWGMETGPVEEAIRSEIGESRAEVAAIGPAGENQVRFAAIMNMANRAHGRTGMGAVMGAKQLKAIAVRGTGRPAPARPELLRPLQKGGKALFDENHDVRALHTHGTAGVVMPQDFDGGLPTHNYRSGTFHGAEAIAGETMTDTILKGRDTCFGCIVRCKRVVAVEGKVDSRYGGPEYETVASFGSYCGVADLTAVAKANELCNRLGMDTISCGATVAFAFEAYERGLITREQAGRELRFGDGEAMVWLVEQIAARRGIGDLLAEGVRRAAQRLGPDARDLDLTVKGSELPAHMPQVKRSLGLIYAVNPFGADHQSSEHDPYLDTNEDSPYRKRLAALGHFNRTGSTVLDQEKVRFAWQTQRFYALTDVLGLCQFDWGPAWTLYGPEHVVDLVRAITGWDVTLEELLTVGERRIHLQRAFNAREGFTRQDDWLPQRLFQPLPDGNSRGLAVDAAQLEAAIDAYYQLAGWDPATGNPTPERLTAVGLDWVAAHLSDHSFTREGMR